MELVECDLSGKLERPARVAVFEPSVAGVLQQGR